MLDACLCTGTHYLDITGEIGVAEAIFCRAEELVQAKIIALPGVGFDVVPTDCLAALLKRQLPDATHLRLAFASKQGRLSRGTMKTLIEVIAQGCQIRQAGKIIVTSPQLIQLPYADHVLPAIGISWGISPRHTTRPESPRLKSMWVAPSWSGRYRCCLG
jgi:short subunit dehydrogenase-like uncharacterized protein